MKSPRAWVEDRLRSRTILEATRAIRNSSLSASKKPLFPMKRSSPAFDTRPRWQARTPSRSGYIQSLANSIRQPRRGALAQGTKQSSPPAWRSPTRLISPMPGFSKILCSFGNTTGDSRVDLNWPALRHLAGSVWAQVPFLDGRANAIRIVCERTGRNSAKHGRRCHRPPNRSIMPSCQAGINGMNRAWLRLRAQLPPWPAALPGSESAPSAP